MQFSELNLKKTLLDAISEMGFREPSPIQERAIPVVLEGRDIIAQAHTGTGKTAAFGLPCLQQICGKSGVELLVITPTRELANQVSDELFAFGKNENIRTVTVFGGQSYGQQIDRIQRGAQVVVATPGRLLDLLKSNRLPQLTPKMVVLDEADEMLDMGFLEDIREIFEHLPEQRQTLLFSATMPKPIQVLAEKILQNPETISVTKKSDGTINRDIEELFCVIEDRERDDAIIRLMDSEDPEKTVIFCRTKSEVDRLATMLTGRGHLAKGLHGDMEQRQREVVMKSFQKGEVTVLVATDVAARGLDVRGISHVINFHIPFEPESYVHRIGRTARAGAKGIAITLATPQQWRDIRRIKQKSGSQMTHRTIPTADDVRAENSQKMLQKIYSQEIHDFAGKYFENLVSEMGIQQTAQKMMSYILESEDVAGPRQIGISGDRLKRFFFDLERKDDRGGFGRSGRRNGGGRNFRGGKKTGGGFRKNPAKSEGRFGKSEVRVKKEHRGKRKK